MIFKDTITPEELEKLPTAQFKGEILVVDSIDEKYDAAIDYLKTLKIIGFDTETKPTFVANSKRNKVALLQLAGRDKACIFRLHGIGMTEDLKKILSSSRIIKVGAAITDDIKALKVYAPFNARGFVDLQSIAENWGIQEKSVRKMAAIILGTRVSKSQQLSNWEAKELSEAQQTYAAVDAWVCQKMYLKLLSNSKVKR
jgi:ribonuclease D